MKVCKNFKDYIKIYDYDHYHTADLLCCGIYQKAEKQNTCIYLHQLIFIKSAYKFLASFQIYNKNEIYFYFYSSFSSKRLVAFLLYVRKIACLSSIHTQTTSFLSKKKWEALHIYFLYTFFYTKACLSRNNNSDTHYYTVCTIFLYQIMILRYYDYDYSTSRCCRSF